MAETKNLRHIRTTKFQWTQQKMADELGVSLRTYARWEVGPPPAHAMKHVDLLARQLPAAPQDAAKDGDVRQLVRRQ